MVLTRISAARRILWFFSKEAWLPLAPPRIKEHQIMDKDRIAGSAKVMAGKVKETVGKVAGDAKLQADGKAEQVSGKVQNAVGGLKDAIKRKP